MEPDCAAQFAYISLKRVLLAIVQFPLNTNGRPVNSRASLYDSAH